MVREGYTLSQASRMVGVSYRQLDYWDRTGLLSPSVKPARGKGSPRLYGFNDVVSLMVVKRLRESGMPLARIRKALRFLKENVSPDGGPPAELQLLTNGKTIFTIDGSAPGPIDILHGGQLSLDLSDQVIEEIKNSLPSLDKPRTKPARRR